MSDINENVVERKTRKRTFFIIRFLIGFIILAVGVFFVNQYLSRKQGGNMTVLDQPSYPVMQISMEKGDYNLMPAYENEIDISLVRNQVSLINAKKELGLKLYCYDYDITAIQYVLFESTPKEPLEEGTLNQLERNEENICTGTIKLEKNLEKGKNYFLQLTVRLDEDTKTFYYTQLQNGSEYHLANYLTFVSNFHRDIFTSDNMEKYAIYLEPSSASTNKSLANVNIESTMSSIFYGPLVMNPQTEAQIKVKEINKTYAVLEAESFASATDKNNVTQYYRITETFKLRYAQERMYLLDYQRQMGALFNGTLIDEQNNDLGIGIQDQDRVSYQYSDDGKKLSFVNEGQLWYYDYSKSKAYKIYSIHSENLADVHNIAGGSDLRILKMDKKGNITFLVFGYMRRGSYEGKNGIAIMQYDVSENYSKEIVFLETSVPFDTMRRGLSKCVYLNSKDKLYCLLDGDLHRIDIHEGTDDLIASDVMNESLTVTKEGNMIALEEYQDKTKNKKIDVMNLETGDKFQVNCQNEERIRAVGFINEDFIYAIADRSDISYKNSGELQFPAKEIRIVDAEGKEVKSIANQGKYIINSTIDGTVIEMQTAKKKGNQFHTSNKKEYVRYKQDPQKEDVSLVYTNSSSHWNQLFFSFAGRVYVKVCPEIIETTMEAPLKRFVVELKKGEMHQVRFFTYAQGQMVNEYATLTEAIKMADKKRGNVIDHEENVLWQCAFMDYAKVPGMTEVEKASDDKKSFKACMRMFAKVTGKDPDKVIVDTSKYSIPELITMNTGKKGLNMSGCSLDEVLYYVDLGAPILTKLTDLRYVIVMSYNSERIRYLDPVTGESTVMDRQEITRLLKARGNYFYSFQK